ncbi:unnamed protein product [Oppiella nova]|uniref:Uncharacterized protein n=1 Tax=Oppiella nova TaxID=334625 RepID=A0A7R9M780_9ACAR|nr:unnamed protein product [Oppiella nova]CAG2172070.1 unnamed protein product [Oppiella nova]
MTRIGKDWTPSAFVGAKIKDPEPFNTPAPTHYSPEKSIYNAKGRQAPSYTFGFKAKESVADVTPAPTAYNVPEPDAYKIQRQPMYTFRPKTEIPRDKTAKPGPADYAIEKVWIDKTNSPNVTFGSRPSPYALSF